jgi:hypothetical protein
MGNKEITILLLVVFISSLLLLNWLPFQKPDKIEPTILIKGEQMVVLEYIPQAGNLFTSSYY